MTNVKLLLAWLCLVALVQWGTMGLLAAQQAEPAKTEAGDAFVAGLPEVLAALEKARKVGLTASGVLTICERMDEKFAALSIGDLRRYQEEVTRYSQVLYNVRDNAGCRAVVERLGKALADAPGHTDEKKQILSFWIARAWMAERNFAAALPMLEAADACLSRIREADDLLRLDVRKHHCQSLYRSGRPREALALHKEVLEILRGLRTKQPYVSVEAERFLGVLSHHSGDRQGAFVAFEKFLAGMLEHFPNDVARVQMARQNLASAMMALHDYAGALELMRKVVEIDKQRVPATNLELIDYQMTIAQVVQQLRDTDESIAILEEVWPNLQANAPSKVRARLIADWHRFRAQSYIWRGEYADGREHVEKAQAWLVRNRPEDDRDRNECLLFLASIQRRAGQFEEALASAETAYKQLRKRQRIDSHFMQVAISEVIKNSRLLGRFDRAVELVSLLHEAALMSLSRTVQASRATGALAKRQGIGIARAVDLMRDEITPSQRSGLAKIALHTSQLRLGMETRVARAASRARGDQREQVRALDEELMQLTSSIQKLANRSASPDRAESLAVLVRDRERVERRLVELSLAAKPTDLPALSDLVAALPDGAAAVAMVRVPRQNDRAVRAEDRVPIPWYVAFLLDARGDVESVDLGPAQGIADLTNVDDQSQRKALRRKVLDPVLAVAEKRGVKRLVVAVDHLLQLVPLSALPLDSGEPVGSKVQIQRVTSLLDLLVDAPSLPATPKLVAVGGVDYDVEAAGAALPLVAAAASELRAHREGDAFAPLPATAGEVADLRDSFGKAFPEGTMVDLVGRSATKRALLRSVPGASILHMATHGFCAARAEQGAKQVARSALDATNNVESLTAYTHCGLAMTGANLPPLDDGSLPGVLTGEELKQFDLVDAYLVVLSACDSARGLRSGASHASLHSALHGAGARFLVSSLWKVGDAAARQIMKDFYDELWRRPDDPHRALWTAKMKARRAGIPFRDWAGFLMTGA